MNMDSQMWETAVFRRMHFATLYLPHDIHHYWDIIATFANQGNPESSSTSPESVRIVMENIQTMNTKPSCLDVNLIRELITMKYGPAKQVLGVPLVPKPTKCDLCGGNLLRIR